ncbi:MAG: OB-fold nucleic acid binding domain-containing protein [Candidatus Woesearchaeota archaeon]
MARTSHSANFQKFHERNELKNFAEITTNDLKKTYSFMGKIEEIKQTSGPTIFTLNDGTRSIKSVAFIAPGERAYPDFELEQIIRISAEVSERDNSIELEIKDMKAPSDEEKNDFLKKMAQIENERSEAKDVPFLVDNEVLQKLKPMIKKVAREIRNAIFTNRPIILKHHHDADGYSSGIALERAIIPLIREQHQTDNAEHLYYKRTPSRAPFYEYTDAVKDVSFTLDDMARYGQKPPLVILTDNGSTPEDIFSIKKVRIFGSRVAVVDHHYPGEVVDGKVEVDKYVDAHVNPYLVGHDSLMCAGILATEVARFVNPDVDKIDHIPAIAATGDRAEGPIIDKYFALAEKKGFTREFLKDLAEAIDFESHYIRFMQSRNLVNELFADNIETQRKMVALITPEIAARKERGLKAARHYMHLEDIGKRLIMSLDADKLTSRGEYPAIGKMVGLTHDSVCNDNPGKAVISMGLGPDFITMRMNDHVEFKLDNLIKELQEKIPYGAIEGGGHEHAGTIKFLQAAKEEVHKIVFDRLRS